MKQPLVSIIIPVYNVEKYIERCIMSVFNQTYKNIELILVDDKSTDKSIEIALAVLENSPSYISSKILYNKVNSGPSITRNKGLDVITGKYVFMIDSDDYITDDCLEKLVAVAERENSEIVVGKTICYDSHDDKEKMYFPINTDKKNIIGNNAVFKAFIDGVWPIVVHNKLYKRKFITDNNLSFVEGILSQDELWAFHCALCLNSISFLKDITYVYYLHGESIIFNRKEKYFEGQQTVAEHIAKEYYNTKSKSRRALIKSKLIFFKKMTLTMQWKSMRHDITYWKKNYSRLKKLPSLSWLDYFSPQFSFSQKKNNFLLNLPTNLGYRLFKQRYNR